MVTLTGYDNGKKTPGEWRAYIERLEGRVIENFENFKAMGRQRKLTKEEWLRFLSREDLLLEHMSRAKVELGMTEKEIRAEEAAKSGSRVFPYLWATT